MRSALLWTGLIVLAALGVITAALRALTIAGQPSAGAFRPAATNEVFPQYAAEMPQFERHFGESPGVVLVHVVTGAVFLSLGLLQFSPRIRNRHRRFHRWSGRFLVALAIGAGLTGLWMGVVAPFSTTERLPTAVVGALFLTAPAVAINAIRRGDVGRHREWMIRFFALGVAIVTIRLVTAPILWLLRPATYGEIVGLTFWAGWLISLAVAEAWIRFTRAERRAALQPAAG